MNPHIHVTRFRCELKHCGWTGFHFHWRHRRYRSARELSWAELAEFDEDCHRMNAEKNTAWSDS